MAQASIFDMTDKRAADKQKALDSALAQIERQFGKGSIMRLGGDNPVAEIEATSTAVDPALGVARNTSRRSKKISMQSPGRRKIALG